MNKKDLTEQEIRTHYITPAIQAAGWKGLQIREEYYFTNGRFHIQQSGRAKRGERSFADYSRHYEPYPRSTGHPRGATRCGVTFVVLASAGNKPTKVGTTNHIIKL